MTGSEYIKFVTELGYEDAIKSSMSELRARGINTLRDLYDNETIYDEPIYPANIELYDEFCDEYGFMVDEYFSFIARRIDLENDRQ